MNNTKSLGSLILTATVLALFGVVSGVAQAQRPSLGLLQGQINQLEAENNAQQAEIDALTAEADTELIVVDSTGEILGQALAIESDGLAVQVKFDLPGLPPFVFLVTKETFQTNNLTPWFESTDCTGQAWTEGNNATSRVVAFVRGNTALLTGIRTIYVADSSDTPQMISRRSRENQGCESIVDQVSAVRLTPVDLDGMFTPPFLVTTRERLQAQP